jgi:hypothetical protein
MLGVADVVRRHGPEYLERHRDGILPSHVRAVHAIIQCRTAALGGHLGDCSHCGCVHLLYHSCRHRACPQCGHDRTRQWLARQREILLPVPYFHVVFALPDEFRRLVRSHQKALIQVLFRAAFRSLAALSADPPYLGAQVGALAVLHTWTRTMEWHPHVHMMVPGGGIAADGTWKVPPRRKSRYLVPIAALSKGFRGRFLKFARTALPDVALPEVAAGKRWVVFAKPVVRRADKVLEYLGRYIHRTALSDKAIVATTDKDVTFAYRDSRDRIRKTMTLPAEEFLRRFLQHVPLKGLHRVRSFGLLHPKQRDGLRRIQCLLSPRHLAPAPVACERSLPRCRDATLVQWS